MKKRIVIALGGNAILNKGEEGTIDVQYTNVYNTMVNVAKLVETGKYEVVITHGNGPQVGAILLQGDAGKDQVPAMPMYVCGAMTQGQIGMLIQQSLTNIFKENNIDISATTIITQVEVSADDPSFKNPSKPVGPFYTKEQSEIVQKETGYTIKEDSGRGYRRVVPSPLPKNIIELKVIKDLINSNNLVIASGGGGIPVIMKDNKLSGIDAVIDKDRSAALMGDLLDADMLIILTAVPQVAINFGKENEKWLDNMTITEAKSYSEAGHFAPGSMKPKVEACIDFVENSTDTSRQSIITDATHLLNAINGDGGTHIIK